MSFISKIPIPLRILLRFGKLRLQFCDTGLETINNDILICNNAASIIKCFNNLLVIFLQLSPLSYACATRRNGFP